MNGPVRHLVTFGLLIASGCLVYLRGGGLAWSGVIVSVLLLAKHVALPSRRDVFVVLGFAALWAASWPAAWAYVRSTWESGEVVEIDVRISDESHAARVWVLDVDGDWLMYYDAPPRIAQALIAGAPMTVERGERRMEGCANATRVSDMPSEERDALLAVMEAKYGEQGHATTIFYAVLGGRKDRIGLALRVEDCGERATLLGRSNWKGGDLASTGSRSFALRADVAVPSLHRRQVGRHNCRRQLRTRCLAETKLATPVRDAL